MEVMREFKCLGCGHEWKVPLGSGRQMVCPKCSSDKIKRTNPGIGGPHHRRKKGFHDSKDC
ncbi:hypothetical protein ACFL3G_00165 [Planctomycetota bacterium]